MFPSWNNTSLFAPLHVRRRSPYSLRKRPSHQILLISMANRLDLGPMTTIFTAPSACSTPYVFQGLYPGMELGWTCIFSDGLEFVGWNKQCYPSPMNPVMGDFYTYPDSVAFFSPATVCPNGYTKACTIPKTASAPGSTFLSTAEYEIWRNLVAGETAIGCCPR